MNYEIENDLRKIAKRIILDNLYYYANQKPHHYKTLTKKERVYKEKMMKKRDAAKKTIKLLTNLI